MIVRKYKGAQRIALLRQRLALVTEDSDDTLEAIARDAHRQGFIALATQLDAQIRMEGRARHAAWLEGLTPEYRGKMSSLYTGSLRKKPSTRVQQSQHRKLAWCDRPLAQHHEDWPWVWDQKHRRYVVQKSWVHVAGKLPPYPRFKPDDTTLIYRVIADELTRRSALAPGDKDLQMRAHWACSKADRAEGKSQ